MKSRPVQARCPKIHVVQKAPSLNKQTTLDQSMFKIKVNVKPSEPLKLEMIESINIRVDANVTMHPFEVRQT